MDANRDDVGVIEELAERERGPEAVFDAVIVTVKVLVCVGEFEMNGLELSEMESVEEPDCDEIADGVLVADFDVAAENVCTNDGDEEDVGGFELEVLGDELVDAQADGDKDAPIDFVGEGESDLDDMVEGETKEVTDGTDDTEGEPEGVALRVLMDVIVTTAVEDTVLVAEGDVELDEKDDAVLVISGDVVTEAVIVAVPLYVGELVVELVVVGVTLSLAVLEIVRRAEKLDNDESDVVAVEVTVRVPETEGVAVAEFVMLPVGETVGELEDVAAAVDEPAIEGDAVPDLNADADKLTMEVTELVPMAEGVFITVEETVTDGE